ncbi:DUF362 domain-containing protein [Methanocella sp. MCL-LM]|uniref:DUF362 domain-containing protein n=1 Tax=Methanocella sp. MCL-LM TaxID=3412035 RepID=UPI003C77DA8E
MAQESRSKVYIIKTADRKEAVAMLLEQSIPDNLAGLRVAIKANYNSADPFPASTHIDTLAAIVDVVKAGKAGNIILAERSGMGITREVLQARGVLDLASRKGVDVIILDDLQDRRVWVQHSAGHWQRGYLFAPYFADVDVTIQTCCLKAHRFGGHFTMSLKNSVGMVARYDPEDNYDYMGELHSSPYQREMIAEINAAYSPAVVIMDAIKGFSKGGPEKGTLVEPGLMLASSDRIAIDACGVALLRSYGTTPEVADGDIFSLPQIRRAAELGLGARRADEIEVIPLNDSARDAARVIENELKGIAITK